MSAELWNSLSCSTTDFVLSVTHTSIVTILTCSVIFVMYQLITNRKMEKFSCIAKSCGHIFTLSILLCLFCSFFVFGGKCYQISWNLYQFSLLIYYLMFGIQSYALIVIFFNRINRVFNGTPFQLSKCTANIFKFFIIVLPCYMVIGLILFGLCTSGCKSSAPLIANIFLLIYIGLLISLLVLFIYKLVQVHNGDANNDILIGAITKMTILASFSVVITFLDGITTVFYFQANDSWSEWIATFVSMSDIYTNFICIIFCYKVFKPYYNKICKCCDRKCRKCWKRVIVDRSDARKMMEIHSKSGASSINDKELTITTTTITGTRTRSETKSEIAPENGNVEISVNVQ